MKKILITIFIFSGIIAVAQDSTIQAKPVITGSVDAYYRFNFANPQSGATNNFTSFTNSKNSFELGMASIRIDHTIGKAGATIDLGFGRRAEEFSYNDGDVDAGKNGFISLSNVKQAFITYAPSSKLKFTAGKFATHVGYEMLDAHLNRNYSMSYMFTNGPFFHTGIKADITAGSVGFMLGVSDYTDQSTATTAVKTLLGQFSGSLIDSKLKFYLNYVGFFGSSEGNNPSGLESLNQIDLVATATISSQFSIGYNGTIQSRKPTSGDGNNWWASALYLNYDPCSLYGVTLRGEYFDDGDGALGINNKILALTLSNNIRVGNLSIIPELRYENADESMFEKNNGNPSKNSFTGLVAAIYHF